MTNQKNNHMSDRNSKENETIRFDKDIRYIDEMYIFTN